MISIMILVLSLIGLWISVYFTGVYYKWFQPDAPWIPRACRLRKATCMAVLDTPRAKWFGVPNSAFGVCLYLYLLLDLFFFFPLLGLLFLGVAVLRSVYLAYSLIFITKVPCPLCFASHAINIALFFMVLKIVVSG